MKRTHWAILSILLLVLRAHGQAGMSLAPGLPDSPGTVHSSGAPAPVPKPPPPCSGTAYFPSDPKAFAAQRALDPCRQRQNPYRLFLDTTAASPLTVSQKGYLAVRDMIDPFNILTVVGNSAITVGIDAHSPYGPGMRGFGKNVGISFLQEATGEFIGTFTVCSLFHQDPHYHRLPQARPVRRIAHAIGRTVIAQSDTGALMPNYENFIAYPATAEISNLYVPGIQGNLPSTMARIFIGLATDPINNLITEFLPDLARRVHIRVVFVQQIINHVARDERM
jgi:hypothetical protein